MKLKSADEFAHNFPKSGSLIFDIQNNSSVDFAGFKKFYPSRDFNDKIKKSKYL